MEENRIERESVCVCVCVCAWSGVRRHTQEHAGFESFLVST